MLWLVYAALILLAIAGYLIRSAAFLGTVLTGLVTLTTFLLVRRHKH